MSFQDHLPKSLLDLYEVYDYNHAAAILVHEFPHEFAELLDVLLKFKFADADVTAKGGNESRIPKKFSSLLNPYGWKPENLEAGITVNGTTVHVQTHKVDYIKGNVAFDLEWNSKDQTFDRDLYAFRTFHEYHLISVGVLVTRSSDLNPYFKSLGKDQTGKKYEDKYGASTTWMPKLIPRLDANRHGGCPVLAIGITRNQVDNTP